MVKSDVCGAPLGIYIENHKKEACQNTLLDKILCEGSIIISPPTPFRIPERKNSGEFLTKKKVNERELNQLNAAIFPEHK